MYKSININENYEVSSEGFVRNKKTGRVLKFDNSKPDSKNPYYRVTLSFGKYTKKFAIHRLVAEHFIDNPLNLPEVNHLDGDRTNNNVDNLEWTTGEDNRKHCEDNNLNPKGERHGNAKYNEEIVLLVRDLTKRGFSRKECAEIANVTISFVKDVRVGRAWKHV